MYSTTLNTASRSLSIYSPNTFKKGELTKDESVVGLGKGFLSQLQTSVKVGINFFDAKEFNDKESYIETLMGIFLSYLL